MAAPASITLTNLNGSFTMNKKLSDPTDPPLTLQGIGWVTRQAIKVATLTLNCKTYEDDKKVIHIDIDQVTTGGFKGTSEKRHMDWTEADHEDHIFGKVRGKSRFVTPAEINGTEAEWLKEGWLPEMTEGDNKFIESYVESVNNGWTANQIWGFAEVEGKRRYVRKAVVQKDGKIEKTRLVYDYVS